MIKKVQKILSVWVILYDALTHNVFQSPVGYGYCCNSRGLRALLIDLDDGLLHHAGHLQIVWAGFERFTQVIPV